MKWQQLSIKTKLLIIAVAILGVLLVIVATLSLLTRREDETKVSVTPFTQSYPLGVAENNGHLYFSNGRQLVSYNPSSGESKTLSGEGALPQIGTLLLSPDNRYIVFQTISQTYDDILGEQLNQRNIDLDQPYWWVFDTTNKRFKLLEDRGLPLGIARMHYDVNGDILRGIATIGESSEFVTFDDQFNPTTTPLKGLAEDFIVKDNVLYYQSGDKLIKGELTKAQINNPKEVLNKIGGLTFAPNGDLAFVVTNSENEGDGYIYNLSTQQKSLNRKVDEPSGRWSSDSSRFYIVAGDAERENSIGLTEIDLATQKSQILVADSALPNNLQFILFASPDLMVVSDENEQLYLVTKNVVPKGLSIPSGDKSFTDGDDVEVNYAAAERSFLVTLFKKDESVDETSQKQRTYELLRKNDINPDIVNIRFDVQPLTRGSDIRD